MDKPQNTVSIPESITINGVTYVVKDTPELLNFMQTVAKVEKNKLYSQFETLKEQIAKLGNVQVVGGEDNKVDIDSIVEKLKGTFVTKQDLQETLKGTVEEVVRPVLQATQKQQEDEIAQYRQKLINDNIATCIPELVQGKTKEELDAALKHSIEIRAAYPTPSTAHLSGQQVHDPLVQAQLNALNGGGTPTPPQPGQQKVPANPPMPPAAPRRPSPEADEGGSNVKQMSMKEFANQRESLLRNLQATFGN